MRVRINVCFLYFPALVIAVPALIGLTCVFNLFPEASWPFASLCLLLLRASSLILSSDCLPQCVTPGVKSSLWGFAPLPLLILLLEHHAHTHAHQRDYNKKGLQTFFLKQLLWTGLVIIHENVLIKQQMWSFLVRSVGSLQRLSNGMQPTGNKNYHFFYSDLQAKDGKLFKAMAWLAALRGERRKEPNALFELQTCGQSRKKNKKTPMW